MINGHGSLGSVALQIIDDFAYYPHNPWEEKRLLNKPWDRMSGYTLDQFIQVVVHEQRSILSMGEMPSYIWWYIGVDRYGEIEPIIDLGKRSPNVIKSKRRKAYWSRMHMMAHQKIENDGKWALVVPQNCDFHLECEDIIMVRRGMSFGQQFLTRYQAKYYTQRGEYEETELEEYGEIIYASIPRFHDIPLSVSTERPSFRGFRS